MNIYASDDLRAWDAYTIQSRHISEVQLMDEAIDALMSHLIPELSRFHRVFVCCGKGNNGGDGLGLARKLFAMGYEVMVYLPFEKESLSAACAIQYQRLVEAGLQPLPSWPEKDPSVEEDVLIDAFLGTGFQGPVRGDLRSIIKQVNAWKCRKISIDLPSGMPGEASAQPDEAVVQSDLCLTIQCPKLSFFLPTWSSLVPRFQVVDIGLPRKFADQLQPLASVIEDGLWKHKLKDMPFDTHKVNQGVGGLLAGNKGAMGAGILAGHAAMRCGLGKAFLVCPEALHSSVYSAAPELMPRTLSWLENEGPEAGLTAWAAGPGMGKNVESLKALEHVLTAPGAKVLDADALRLLAEHPNLWEYNNGHWILTPHLGEFRALVGAPKLGALEANRMALQWAEEKRVVLVLKGPRTLVTDGQEQAYNASGNAGLATAGSGDVLTGMILAALGQGMPVFEAACMAVQLHGNAADLWAEKYSPRSLMASDIIGLLPKLMFDKKV